MSDYPLISLVIPVYNTERFLERSIKSAIAQNYPNLEILILNNGSTDGSQSIIDKYSDKDSRIVTYTIEHVETVKESVDNCYYRAKGNWIITLDSDDTLSDNYVMGVWNRHIETSADFVAGRMVSVSLDGNILEKLPLDGFNFDNVLNGKEAMSMTIKKWVFGLNGALINRSCLNNIYLENPACFFYTDEVDGRLSLLAADKVAFTKAEYYYTFNPASTGKKKSWNKYKYKLNTRLGLLKLTKREFGKKSPEYEHIIYQSLGVLYLAILYIVVERKNSTNEQKRNFVQLAGLLFKAMDLNKVRLSTYKYCPVKWIERLAVITIKYIVYNKNNMNNHRK